MKRRDFIALLAFARVRGLQFLSEIPTLAIRRGPGPDNAGFSR